jgi:hypothetical protein
VPAKEERAHHVARVPVQRTVGQAKAAQLGDLAAAWGIRVSLIYSMRGLLLCRMIPES